MYLWKVSACEPVERQATSARWLSNHNKLPFPFQVDHNYFLKDNQLSIQEQINSLLSEYLMEL